jgi:pimeloyl-ACP methyl ester carboxylesterase
MAERSTRRRRRRAGALAAVALLAGLVAFVHFSFAAAVDRASARVEGRSELIRTRFGALEYAIRGEGEPLLMIHGTGGGFDQGLLFSEGIAALGHQIIAPSRFGYLRSDFPADPSPENQADAFVDLLDNLKLDQVPVAGGSAGALSALHFALRHPERCSGLILIVPAAYAPGRRPVAPTRFQLWIMENALQSDFLFWAALKIMPDRLLETLLATDPELVASASPGERRRAYRILEEIMPISRRSRGLKNDTLLAGNPGPAALAALKVPVLIISVADDGFHTDEAARYIAAQVRDSKLVIYPSGGHIWVGRDKDLSAEIDRFARGPGRTVPARGPTQSKREGPR